MVKYYQETDRALSAANMQWSTVLANFEIRHKVLKDVIKMDLHPIPKLKKNDVVTK